MAGPKGAQGIGRGTWLSVGNEPIKFNTVSSASVDGWLFKNAATDDKKQTAEGTTATAKDSATGKE